jgi:hypothetical protein
LTICNFCGSMEGMKRAPASLLAVSTVLCTAIVLLVAPAGAAAITTWTAEAEACGGAIVNGVQVGSERGSGQMDGAGRLYLPCSANDAGVHDNYLAILDQAGRRIGKVPLDFTPADGIASTDRASDVAASPDGSFLYVVHYASYTVYRFDRQGDGSYRARSQAEWSLANFPGFGGGGSYLPRGQFIATDGAGNIYLSAGLWTCQAGSPHCTDNAIVKYTPAGALVTRFGRKSGGSWALGDSHGNFGGLAVTADGRRVFATDINNSRVQRFDRAADGSYGAVLAMGMNQQTDPNRWGACFGDGALAGAYDLAMSAGGELLVANTTCYNDGRYAAWPVATIEVQRFGQDGSIRGSIIARSLGIHRIHGIAVDRTGNLHLVQAKAVLRPAAGWTDAGADAGGGGPLGGAATVDVTAPVVTAVAVPATTAQRTITIGVAATDATGVTELRISEDGAQGAWRPFTGSFQHVLADRYGVRQLVLEVRDAAGNVSAPAAASVTWPAPVAPTPVQPAPAQPRPTQPAPTQPGQPAPTGPTVDGGGGGGAAVELPRPRIVSATVPVQVFTGRQIIVGVRATGESPVTHVRFSTVGRWSTWQPISGRRAVLLPAGVGWKGLLVQVVDEAGTRSVPWFQPILMGPRGVQWSKGTTKADKIATGRGSQHIDVSGFDKVVDRVSCGAGYDTVYAQPDDVVAKDCERVTRVKMPAW